MHLKHLRAHVHLKQHARAMRAEERKAKEAKIECAAGGPGLSTSLPAEDVREAVVAALLERLQLAGAPTTAGEMLCACFKHGLVAKATRFALTLHP